MNNIAIIKQGTGRYLFSVPENVTLHEGDRVKCSTKRGITDGIAFADSAWVDENVSQLIGKLTGAKFPLKSVVGKLEYLPFEKPQDKPAANPTNKYEGMSNTQLKIAMCTRGSCHVCNDGRRKLDCLFADDYGCPPVTAANRAKVIKYLLAEDAEEAPKPEDKQEPIKLYCVKNYISIFADKELVKGKVYEFDGHRVNYECSQCFFFKDFEDWKRGDSNYAACLVPLVKRPAKVGEWVLLDLDDCFHKNKQGDVVEVVKVFKNPPDTISRCFINDPTLEYSSGICVSFEDNYSYVLDGYHAEPEAEPEYWGGKVVCVSSADSWFTVGKMYEFVNGKVKDNDGDFRSMTIGGHDAKSVDGWNDFFGTSIARFIEFKGEAHD